MPPIVHLENISFVRGEKRILSNVSWQIEPGQHWALLGANGSGKTTVLKIVSGYEWPTSGRVSVLGRRFGHTDLRDLRKKIGWVSNALSERLPGHHTARQIVASGFDATLGLYREISPNEWLRCDEILEQLNASAITTQSFQTLSQGEQQRVRIARALANRPALLILDEPCAGLDPVSRRDFLQDVATFANDAASPTIVLVTHHIEEIGQWVTHCLSLKEGRVAAAGLCDEVLTSENLSRVFDSDCVVDQTPAGWRLDMP